MEPPAAIHTWSEVGVLHLEKNCECLHYPGHEGSGIEQDRQLQLVEGEMTTESQATHSLPAGSSDPSGSPRVNLHSSAVVGFSHTNLGKSPNLKPSSLCHDTSHIPLVGL